MFKESSNINPGCQKQNIGPFCFLFGSLLKMLPIKVISVSFRPFVSQKGNTYANILSRLEFDTRILLKMIEINFLSFSNKHIFLSDNLRKSILLVVHDFGRRRWVTDIFQIFMYVLNFKSVVLSMVTYFLPTKNVFSAGY